MHISSEHTISIACQWHHWDVLSKSIKYRPHGILGTPLHQLVVPWKFHQVLLLIQCMDHRNRCQKSIRHIIYIINTTETPEDAVVQVAQQLIFSLKGELNTAMDESGIYQINGLDAILKTTDKKLW